MQSIKAEKTIFKSISFLLIISLIWISLPLGYASAAIIGTEIVANSQQGNQARSYIKGVLARQDVQNILIKQGINIKEAKLRIGSLTDKEAIQLAKEIERLPAGGDVWSALIIASLIVFVILLFTDIFGYTDIFPFVKKVK